MKNKTQTIEEVVEEFECEFGLLHRKSCGVFGVNPCNCDMKGLKPYLKQALTKAYEQGERDTLNRHTRRRQDVEAITNNT